MNKKIISIICIMVLMFNMATITYAVDLDNVLGQVGNAASNANMGNAEAKAADLTTTVLNVVTYTGIVLGMVMLVIFGVRWMTANPAAKSKLKEEVWNYVLGIVFLLGAGPIATLVYNLMSNIGK